MKIRKIFKYLRYCKMCFKINYKSLKIYTGDFIVGLIAAVINCLASLIIIFFIYDIVPHIDGWSMSQVLFLYGLNTVGCSIWGGICINTITLPYYLRDGEFDRFLIRPINPILQIMMDGFDEGAIGEFIVGCTILLYSCIKLKISLLYILTLPIFAISAAILYTGISVLLSTCSFYTISKADFANLTFELQNFGNYPLTIYSKILKLVFSTVLPIGFIAYYPSLFFMNTNKKSIWLIMVIVVPLFSYGYYKFSKFIWTKFGLEHYNSTGT